MQNGSEILRQINWTKELRDSGMPDPVPVYTNSRIKDAKNLAKEYVRLNGSRPDHPEVYLGFYGTLKELFMIQLTKYQANRAVLQRVDEDLRVTVVEYNPEVLLYWLQLNIHTRLSAVRTKVEELLASFGRGRYILPIYRSLASADIAFARSLFQKYGLNYHPKMYAYINEILK